MENTGGVVVVMFFVFLFLVYLFVMSPVSIILGYKFKNRSRLKWVKYYAVLHNLYLAYWVCSFLKS